MRGRLDLFGRMVLLMVGNILLLGSASVTIIVIQSQLHRSHVPAFLRIRQTAGLIDLATGPNAPPRDLLMRVANGTDLSTAIVAVPPPMTGLHPASRLTAKLQSFMRTRTPVTAGINPRYKPTPSRSGIEEYLAAAVAGLPDGRVLVLTTNAWKDEGRPRLFGMPASLCMGFLRLSWWSWRYG